jgi:hypothetical protein
MIDGYSRRSIILFIITTIAATAITIVATFYVITQLAALHDLNDPLAKSGGLSQEQERALKRN